MLLVILNPEVIKIYYINKGYYIKQAIVKPY